MNSGHMQVLGAPASAPAVVNAPFTFKDFLKHDQLDVTLDQTDALLSGEMMQDHKKWHIYKMPITTALSTQLSTFWASPDAFPLTKKFKALCT